MNSRLGAFGEQEPLYSALLLRKGALPLVNYSVLVVGLAPWILQGYELSWANSAFMQVPSIQSREWRNRGLE